MKNCFPFPMIITFYAFFGLFSTLVHSQDTAKGGTLFAQCISCHGEKGEGNLAQKAPKLSGQHHWYIVKQLVDAKTGVRKTPIMASYASKLSLQDIKDLAAYIEQL